ncbi:ATP-dependent helicase HrpB [Sediminitomix flava]|uniref:ATP-dependent helicase HrpB n=1 Tax=Sediminitomix flava TaxID=379075 RepID=A0A315Z5P7_SEDFL|nr:ATP-dependent helicase HrpB [Sediminitomix flava]PWJ38466.1 ATP-dependent helicase HrpB [Sediminitomix flava]
MAFDFASIDLPVKDIIPEVKNHLENEQTLIIKAPPGAGKSTLLPLALLEQSWLGNKKILMLEPRRLAAKSIAARMADLLGEEVGQTVGYRIRFETKVSSETKIEVLTEGILTRMLHNDNALENIGLIIFDEFHERSLNADVALALSRESQQVLRPDLKLLIMSATLDMKHLSTMLNAKVVESEGRQYPVAIHHLEDTDPYLIPELTANAIIRAVKKHEGDVLAFLPGQGEIMRCEGILRNELPDFKIHPLFGQLPQGKQRAAILPNREGKRKVVLSTSIAETSLTIEGIKIVVDSGFGRHSEFDPQSALTRLKTHRISRDSADQRAGRAGRLSEGVCYRLWNPVTNSRLDEHRMPEIEQADLASLVLDMAEWGIRNPEDLTWLTPPPKGSVSQAKELLHSLDALEHGNITEHGKELHQLPTHPRIAHMLVYAEENDLLALATDLAALLEERDPLGKEHGTDINERIEALRRYRKEKGKGKRFAHIEKIANSYRKLFKIEAENNYVDAYETGILLAHAYPERIACARPGNNAQFQLSNGKIAFIGHKDDLAHEPWLAVASIDARDEMGKIFLASPLDPKDLAPMVKQKEVITWDYRDGELIASNDLRIGNIVLKSTPIHHPDESLRQQAICDAIKKDGERLLDFNKDVQQWQSRILSLRHWNPEQHWPDVSTASLLVDCEKWISPYINKVKNADDLKKLNLLEILQHSLDWEFQEKLEKLAPSKIKVPSGSNIKIQYDEKGNPPILAVRLQEVFGLEATPMINNGKNGVLMHLLSPGFKVVQITADLRSFWENTYFEVKKEMKRRYPKHSWPDDPTDAEAVRGVKRKK